MLSEKNVRRMVFKLISTVMVCAIILNDLSFVAADPIRHLSPPSKFNPIVTVVPGIEGKIGFPIDHDDIASNGTKIAFKRTIESSRIFRRIITVHDDLDNILTELVKNSYDSYIDRLDDSSLRESGYELVITLKAYYDSDDFVVAVIDNGKPVELNDDGSPVYRKRYHKRHFGGSHDGLRQIGSLLKSKGGSIQWQPTESGTKTEIRIPKHRISGNGPIEKDEYIAVEAKHDASMMARAAFRDISIMIGRYLRIGVSEHTLKKHIKNHAANLRKFIAVMKDNIPAPEQNWSRASDPILKGFAIDELSYDEKTNAFLLPLYRNGEKAFVYKYYIDGNTKAADMVIPLGDGTDVFVKTETVARKEALPKGSIPAVFAFLRDNKITTPEKALTGEDIAARLGRSYETIKYDLRGLYRHLRLIDKVETDTKGKGERYYLAAAPFQKAAAIAPVLGLFAERDLRPTKACLELIYELSIRPLFLPEGALHKDPAAFDRILKDFEAYYSELFRYLGRMASGEWTDEPKRFAGRIAAYEKIMDHINASFLNNFKLYAGA